MITPPDDVLASAIETLRAKQGRAVLPSDLIEVELAGQEINAILAALEELRELRADKKRLDNLEAMAIPIANPGLLPAKSWAIYGEGTLRQAIDGLPIARQQEEK